MSASIVYQNDKFTVYCADAHDVFRPYPAKDTLTERAKKAAFSLPIGKEKKNVFQIIVASKENVVVRDVLGRGVFCFAVQGYAPDGEAFRRTMPIEAGKPWPLWCLIDASAADSDTEQLTLVLADGEEISFAIQLTHTDESVFSLYDRDSLARLEWLNSREGTENTLPQGFSPVKLDGQTIKLLGRDIRLNNDGAIVGIHSYFVGNNSTLSSTPRELLEKPIAYAVYEDGQPLRFKGKAFSFTSVSDTHVGWEAVGACGELLLTVTGRVEFDGTVTYNAKLENCRGRKLTTALTHYPRAEFAKYFVGLGRQGQKLPESFTWKWDEEKQQDAYWCGSINGGVYACPQMKQRAYPFVNIYYHHGEKNLPATWVNNGKGYFALDNGDALSLQYNSGEITCTEDSLEFCMELMISPFKLVDQHKHWKTHYYHKNYNDNYTEADILDAVANGCTHINLHHGNDTLPFLNYPLYDFPAMKALSDLAHKHGLGLKPYYTVREQTTRMPEIYALRALREEIFPLPTTTTGALWQEGRIDPFIVENFGKEAIPAWKHTFDKGAYAGTTDPTVIANSNSRICNFYVGCISWMAQQKLIDGLYLDDVGYDRTVMRRVRRVFDQYNPDARIDFHTWNHFEDRHGAGYGHNCLIYANLFPYLDSLWIGEEFDYENSSAEYMLTEVSGLPFGLMSEMLQGRCNAFRGMLYGMTSRYPFYRVYSDVSPVPLWKLRERFGFDDVEMIGYWEDEKPVWSNVDGVECTTYYNKKQDRYLCCFANFNDGEVEFVPQGKIFENRRIVAPLIDKIQSRNEHIRHGGSIRLKQSGGIILWIE